MPAGAEDVARAFYGGRLGLTDVPKPPSLAVRGGCWFEAGPVRLHLGVEANFQPAHKAHPALLVADLDGLIAEADLDITWSDEIPGIRRGHIHDPFGNRIELIDEVALP